MSPSVLLLLAVLVVATAVVVFFLLGMANSAALKQWAGEQAEWRSTAVYPTTVHRQYANRQLEATDSAAMQQLGYVVASRHQETLYLGGAMQNSNRVDVVWVRSGATPASQS